VSAVSAPVEAGRVAGEGRRLSITGVLAVSSDA
jgi:hypothetical protein